jgi:cell division initiation protein
VSATNLDVPLLINPEQIRRREFVTVRRGYDPDQVREYLGQLADQFEQVRSMLQEARSAAQAARAEAKARPDPYERLATRVASVIRAADDAAEKIRRDANHDAERMTVEARADADRIRTDAQSRAEVARSQAEAAVRSAREEADRTLAGLATRRDALVDQLASMQERLLGVARDLEAAIDLKEPLPELPQASFEPASEPTGALSGRNGSPAGRESAGRTDEPPVIVPDRSESGGGTEPLFRIADEEAGGREDEPSFIDPSYEELWEGTAALRFDIPDIPPLDLDWSEGDPGD